MNCQACGGPPMTGGGYNVVTKKYDVPEEVRHLCPTRAEAGDYEGCNCCETCMRSAYACGRRERPAA